jgi:DNA-directed RNA polymerase specialized sigma24 family protein
MRSDAELITRWLAGDGEAFVEVVGRREGAVGAYLARRGPGGGAGPARRDLAHVAAGWDPWPGVDGRVAVETELRASLARLRPQEREVLTLVAWEDLTVADAARALGLPAGTARRLLHQARQALRSMPGMVAFMTEDNTVKESK